MYTSARRYKVTLMVVYLKTNHRQATSSNHTAQQSTGTADHNLTTAHSLTQKFHNVVMINPQQHVFLALELGDGHRGGEPLRLDELDDHGRAVPDWGGERMKKKKI